ncbi:hypothetical protein D9M71_300160 [compost metagenome]
MVSHFQRVQQRNQRTDERSVQPTDLVVGLDPLISIGAANGITEQHSSQSEAPAVLLQFVG